MTFLSASRFSAGALLVFAAGGCGSLSSSSARVAPSSKVVGPSGGTATSSDGSLAIAIPSGALPSNVTITVTPTSSPGAGEVGTAFEIGPTGTTFNAPVTMTFHYGGANLEGHPASDLRVATFAAGAWQPLGGLAEDTSAKTVSGTTTHLSPYAMWLPTAVGPVCTSISEIIPECGAPPGGTCPGTTCADTTASAMCGSFPGSSMQSCSTTQLAITASCCFAAGTPLCFEAAGTCAGVTTTACGFYPGSTCSDSNGSSACCFPSGQPVCVMASGNCVAPPGPISSSSSGGSSCSPATCEDSSPCAEFNGSTMQSCADSPTGYQASCCYPPGTLPPGPGSSQTGTVGSSGGGSPGGPVPPVDASVPVVTDGG